MPEQVLLRPGKPSAQECRVYERQPCDVPTECRPAAAYKEATWSATIRNISIGGIRLVIKRRFEPGTCLAVELPGNDDAYRVLAKVVYTQAAEAGSWAHGCRFISELSEGEVERLLKAIPGATRGPAEIVPPAEGSATAVNPTAAKAAANPTVANATVANPTAANPTAAHATVINPTVANATPANPTPGEKTVGDVRLRLALRQGTLINCVIRRFRTAETWPVPPGKVISFRGGTGDDAWTLTVRVRHCVHYKEHWLVDAELVNPPSVGQLLKALARIDDAKH
jgi:PilZ domain